MKNPQPEPELDRIQLLEEQLMRAQRLSSVGALASSITHEFNNILTTVINYAKMGVRHKDEATRDKAETTQYNPETAQYTSETAQTNLISTLAARGCPMHPRGCPSQP